MEAEAILRIRPALMHYLHQYDDCVGRCTARRPMHTSSGPDDLPDAGLDATPQCRCRMQPPQADTSTFAHAGVEIEGHDSLRLESLIAY